MVLKDDYGKDILLVDKENLIYKRVFRKVTIKKSDIRSIFYDDVILGVLTYGGKIYSLNIKKLLFSERDKLEDLRVELNRENILFDYTNYRCSTATLPLCYFFLPMLINLGSIINAMILVALIGFALFYIFYKKGLMTNIVFNIDKDEFEVLRGKHTYKYKKHEIDKIKVVRNYNINIIEFKKNGNKYNINFKETPYFVKIYNNSITKLFN